MNQYRDQGNRCHMVRFVACRMFLSCLIAFADGRPRRVTVCPGTGLSIQDLAEYSRKSCTVIEGPLVLHGITSSDSNDMNNETVTDVPITPLSSIVEITGALVVFGLEKSVHNLGQILPNLAVVRGHPHHRYPKVNVSVSIAHNKYLKSINLTRLTHIQGDDERTAPALLSKNENLQYIHTVKWDWISSERLDAVFSGNSEEEVRCPERCNGSCWSENSCQTFFNCSAVDSDGKCTCHEECLSSCSGPADYDCISCKNFHYQGRCVPTCPNGTFVVAGWRCLDKCPYAESDVVQSGKRIRHQMFAFNGECVLHCPGNYTEDNHTKTCVPCSNASSCEKRCSGGTIISLHDAERFQRCVHVDGSLEINILTESNGKGDLSRYLGSIEHVEGYVVVIKSQRLKTLEFLDNLTSISARSLWQFGEELYGLAIVNNRNLRSVRWKQQHNLWLGERTDVQILLESNYVACKDGIMDLQLQFPFAVDSDDNGILAVCNPGHLNLTTKENDNGTTYLQWDPVPYKNQTHLIGYQIFWQTVRVVKSIPDPLPEEYDDNNPDSCQNTRWRSVTVGNVTSHRLNRDILRPWTTAVFQVRAEFRRRGIGFKSELLRVNGTLAVPSCPILEHEHSESSNLTISWWPPKYYSQNVTYYRIGVSLLDEPVLMADMSSHHDNSTPCSADTAISHSHHPCINYTLNVTHHDPWDDGPFKTTIRGLQNYFKYQVEIQAASPAGCGLVLQRVYATEPDYKLDEVSDLNITAFPGPSPSTANLHVSWKKPEYPNGGHVHYYEVRIEFQVSRQEESNFQHSHNQWVLPRMKELGCNYTSGDHPSGDHPSGIHQSEDHQFYFCQIRSKGTWISLNFTVMRVPGRQLSYKIIIRVASALGKPSQQVPETEEHFAVSEDPSAASPYQRSSGSRVTVVVIVLTVLACLMIFIVVLVYVLWRQKRKHKRQSRDRLEALSQLYTCLDEGMLLSGEYLPDEWEIQRDEVVLDGELGRGAFGLVYQGIWQNSQGQRPLDVAVKTLNDEASSEDRLSFLYEASIMKHFSCDHIVRLLGVVSQGTPLMVVMELMGKGDLKGYLRSLRPENEEAINYENFPISEEELLQIAVQIASGMVYLTKKKFIHRDLAARNCMVTEDIHIKIGDFGLTRDVYQSDYYRRRGRGVLPVRWMPPESLRDGVFTHSSDIWSFGIVLWEVATLAMQPYPGMSNSEVFEYVVGGGVMDIGEMKHVPNVLTTIMESCWLYRPSDRPTFESILGRLPPWPLHGHGRF